MKRDVTAYLIDGECAGKIVVLTELRDIIVMPFLPPEMTRITKWPPDLSDAMCEFRHICYHFHPPLYGRIAHYKTTQPPIDPNAINRLRDRLRDEIEQRIAKESK